MKEEALLALLILAALWLTSRPRLGRAELCGVGLLCALCPLTKLTALFLPAMLLSWALWDWLRQGQGQARSLAQAVALGTATGLVFLGCYVAALDWRLGAQVWAWMAGKPSGPIALWRLVSHAALVEHHPLGQGWNAWMWTAALPLLVWRLPRVGWLVGIYLLLLTLGVDERHIYSWYTLPVRPLLVMAAAGALFSRFSSPALWLFGLLYLGPALLWLMPGLSPWFGLAVPGLWLAIRSEAGRRRLAWALILLAAGLGYRLSADLPDLGLWVGS